MNYRTKITLCSIAILILSLAACSASPSVTATNPEPTLPEVNPFDPTPTSQTQPGGGTYLGGYSQSMVGAPEDYTFTYEGEPIQLSYYLEGTGFDTEIGAMFFLDGVLQPHTIVTTTEENPEQEAGQEVLMSKHRVSKDGRIDFTFSINPVTGKAGDELGLLSAFMWEPSFMPDDEKGNFGIKGDASFYIPLTVIMKTGAPQQAESYAAEIVTEPIPQSEKEHRQSDMNSSGRIDQTSFNLYTGEYNWSTNGISATNGKIDLELCGYGGMETDYRVTIFLNHEPVTIAGRQDFLMGLHYDQMSKYKFTLDIRDYQRVNTLYAMIVPVGQSYKDPDVHAKKTRSVLLINDTAAANESAIVP
jgi:hypothetical protein